MRAVGPAAPTTSQALSDRPSSPPGGGEQDPDDNAVGDRLLSETISLGPTSHPTPTQAPSGASQIRRIGSQTMVYAAGVLIGRALSFVLLPLYTRYLSPADYGVIQLIELVFDMLTVVAGARLASGLYHFYYKAESLAERRQLLSTATLALGASYILVGAIAFVLAPQLSMAVFEHERYTTVIRVSAISFPLQGIAIVPLLILRAQERPGYFVALSTGKLVAQALLNVLFLVVFKLGVMSIFLSTLITSTLLTGWLVVEQARTTGVHFSPAAFRRLARYGLPLVLTQVATLFTTFADRFFLQRAGDRASLGVSEAGEYAVGLYALAYQFGFLLLSVGVEPLASVWTPVRFDIARRPDRDAVFSRVFIVSNLMVLTLAVGIALYVRDVIGLLAAPSYFAAARLVPVILFAYVFQAWSGIQDTGIMISEQTHWNTIANWAAAIVALIGYLTLIPRYLGAGAAWATVFALAVRHVIIYVVSQRLWPVRWEWTPVMRMLGIAVIVVLAREALPVTSRLVSIAVATALFATYVLGVLVFGGLPESIHLQGRAFLRSPQASLLNMFGASGRAQPDVA